MFKLLRSALVMAAVLFGVLGAGYVGLVLWEGAHPPLLPPQARASKHAPAMNPAVATRVQGR